MLGFNLSKISTLCSVIGLPVLFCIFIMTFFVHFGKRTKFKAFLGTVNLLTTSPVLLIIYSLFSKVAFLYAGLRDIQFLT
jgi:hypothetical protein